MKPMFAPSLMCADFLNLKQQIEILNDRADFTMWTSWMAIMSEIFSLSPDFIKQLKPFAKLPMDAHLMVDNPADFLEVLADPARRIFLLMRKPLTGMLSAP